MNLSVIQQATAFTHVETVKTSLKFIQILSFVMFPAS